MKSHLRSIAAAGLWAALAAGPAAPNALAACVDHASPLAKAVVEEMSRVRLNPRGYAQELAALRPRYITVRGERIVGSGEEVYGLPDGLYTGPRDAETPSPSSPRASPPSTRRCAILKCRSARKSSWLGTPA